MSVNELKQKSAKLFNIIVACAAVNVLLFLATGLYVSQEKSRLDSSKLKELDPQAFAEQVANLKIIGITGFSLAMLALLICIPFVLKRMSITKSILAEENKAIEDLGVK